MKGLSHLRYSSRHTWIRCFDGERLYALIWAKSNARRWPRCRHTLCSSPSPHTITVFYRWVSFFTSSEMSSTHQRDSYIRRAAQYRGTIRRCDTASVTRKKHGIRGRKNRTGTLSRYQKNSRHSLSRCASIFRETRIYPRGRVHGEAPDIRGATRDSSPLKYSIFLRLLRGITRYSIIPWCIWHVPRKIKVIAKTVFLL